MGIAVEDRRNVCMCHTPPLPTMKSIASSFALHRIAEHCCSVCSMVLYLHYVATVRRLLPSYVRSIDSQSLYSLRYA